MEMSLPVASITSDSEPWRKKLATVKPDHFFSDYIGIGQVGANSAWCNLLKFLDNSLVQDQAKSKFNSLTDEFTDFF